MTSDRSGETTAEEQAGADAADVQRVLAGDVEAFAGIVRRWQHRLINLAWRFSRDRAAAEDMAQEVFVRAFRSLHTFRGESAFSTWLTAIALNVYRSWLRARPPRERDIANPATLLALRAPDTVVADRDDAVRRAVLTLPRRYREALVMFYFEEKDAAEAARLLGVPLGTLKARLHRGRALLERRLRETFGHRGRKT